MALERISGFTVIPISISHSPFIKNLFVKEYTPPHKKQLEETEIDQTSQIPSLPLGRTLFVTNLTYDCTKEDLETIFSSFGPIEEIILDSFPDHAKQQQRKKILDTMHVPPTSKPPKIVDKVPFAQNGFAYIIFKNTETLQTILKKTKKEEFYGKCERGEERRGMKKWMTEYKKQTQYKPQELRQLADRYMEEFDKKEAEEKKRIELIASQPDEEGWTLVTSKRGHGHTRAKDLSGATVGPANLSQEELLKKKEKEANKIKTDFYKFQKRQQKLNKILLLRQKFEEDKKRIAKMRENRRFRPY